VTTPVTARTDITIHKITSNQKYTTLHYQKKNTDAHSTHPLLKMPLETRAFSTGHLNTTAVY